MGHSVSHSKDLFWPKVWQCVKWSMHICQKHVALLVNVTIGVYVQEELVEG